MIQATSYALHARQRTISGMRAKTHRTATWYQASVINEDGSVLDNRGAWDIGTLYRWLESFGFDVSLDAAVIA